ncbi:unnamed protein product, partial [Prorocentrum cordatum]
WTPRPCPTRLSLPRVGHARHCVKHCPTKTSTTTLLHLAVVEKSKSQPYALAQVLVKEEGRGRERTEDRGGEGEDRGRKGRKPTARSGWALEASTAVNQPAGSDQTKGTTIGRKKNEAEQGGGRREEGGEGESALWPSARGLHSRGSARGLGSGDRRRDSEEEGRGGRRRRREEGEEGECTLQSSARGTSTALQRSDRTCGTAQEDGITIREEEEEEEEEEEAGRKRRGGGK